MSKKNTHRTLAKFLYLTIFACLFQAGNSEAAPTGLKEVRRAPVKEKSAIRAIDLTWAR